MKRTFTSFITICILAFASCNSDHNKTETANSNTAVTENIIPADQTYSTADSSTILGEQAEEEFAITVKRGAVSGNLQRGELFVNNKSLGTTYENNTLKINSGTYPGYMRYISQRGHVQGTDGYMGDSGDFLLEIGNVTWSNGTRRTSLLFHAGNQADQSQGCIMLGPVTRDAAGNRVISTDHPLRKLRREFYGTDTPISSPNKRITITIL